MDEEDRSNPGPSLGARHGGPAAAPRIGPPPDCDAIAELLVERYPIRRGEQLVVRPRVRPAAGLALELSGPRDRYSITVEYLRGANGRDVWMLLADALDGLFGMLQESERAHRELPAGTDVELDGAFFRVEVERAAPDLEAEADRLLGLRDRG